MEKSWRYAWLPTFCHPGLWVWFDKYLEVKYFYSTQLYPEVLNYHKGVYEIR